MHMHLLIAHGVGFRLPSDPLANRSRNEDTGAANVIVAITTPKEGQT